jgi:hypothetical protein
VTAPPNNAERGVLRTTEDRGGRLPAVLRWISVAILRASLWSVLVGALITFALWMSISPELEPGLPVATWFGLSCALALVPSFAMELGVAHLLLDLGSEEPASDSAKKP